MENSLETLEAWASPCRALPIWSASLLSASSGSSPTTAANVRAVRAVAGSGSRSMLYPYAVWQTWLLYLVGARLSIAVGYHLR